MIPPDPHGPGRKTQGVPTDAPHFRQVVAVAEGPKVRTVGHLVSMARHGSIIPYIYMYM